jgi:Papain-like cysteine protease AvrRpt2
MAAAQFLAPFQPVPAGAAAPAIGYPPPLDVTMPRPKPTQWCWAATASAVWTYYAARGSGKVQTPCEIASKWLSTSCCPEPTDPNDHRNKPSDLQSALGMHLSGNPAFGTISFQQIKTEIDARRPVCCLIHWHGGPGQDNHYNMIVGYHPATQDVEIRDCQYDTTTLPYTSLCKTYQGTGTWDQTYLTK